MKVLNLYAGIGGNRQLWTDVKVTAVENNESIAAIYQDFFPDDKMIIADAHQYLEKNYDDFDFIWSSPPCPTHSRIRNMTGVGRGQNKPIYPDMRLYQEIIFLRQILMTKGTQFNGSYVVENVIPYYEPLIVPQKVGRHCFWANFKITDIKLETMDIAAGTRNSWSKILGINIDKYKTTKRKDTVYRNSVNPKLGNHILECARGNYNYLKQSQENLFKKEAKNV